MILKLTDIDGAEYFMHWSAIQDAPLSYGCKEEELEDYWKEHYGSSSMDNFHASIRRAKKTGCSSFHDRLEEIIATNRAGEDEGCLTEKQLIDKFCKNWRK